MSIVALQNPPAAEQTGVRIWVLLSVLSLGSLIAALAAGWSRPRLATPWKRVAPGRSALPLLGVMFGAIGVYFFAFSLYSTLKYPHADTQPTTPPQFSSADQAVLSTVPPLLALAALLAGDAVVRESTGHSLGLARRGSRPGLLIGVAAGLVILPPLYLLSALTEVIYQRVHYQHPSEHPLLRVLGERPSAAVTTAIIVGACLIAPPFEELLFRGHLQTLLVQMFRRLRSAAPAAEPGMVEHQAAWPAWLGIVLTSAMFALVHPAWSQPVIFALALCLGYAYERTANLWVPIAMHMTFNAVSTLIFLGLGQH